MEGRAGGRGDCVIACVWVRLYGGAARHMVKPPFFFFPLAHEIERVAFAIQHSVTDAVVCASCPQTQHVRVAEFFCNIKSRKPLETGDTLKKRRGEGWIPKWDAKIVMTTVSKAHALKTNKTHSLCIAGRKICGAEMARQPAPVSAINTGMAKPVYRVRVELTEICEFLERYLPFFFSPPLEQVHLYGEATRTNWGAEYALVCCIAEKFGV